ncbi:Predicted arabinose efflux permease, MFS family [Caloramator quimbayensis]|uniref:Predicted arabinose efflux permease, MFS family n=1 Tax=Caloramator quimbayensis TaxID=1147123 RepID=A0A1T4YGQ5_9CLOT|nr:Predicted arabinose efflux permease, MFS family [Caloramator quimbayensis]
MDLEVSNLNKRNVYLMYLIIFLQGFVFYGPVAVIYRQSRGLAVSSIFIIESISWILMIILEIPWGYFADRFGYKKTLVVSNILFFISKVVFYKAHSFNMFLLERILMAFSLSGISGCDIALLYSSIDEKESEKVFGRYSALSNAGLFSASIISSFLVKYSLDSTALLTTVFYGIASIFTFFLTEVEVKNKNRINIKLCIEFIKASKNIILLMFAVSLINEVVQAVAVFLYQIKLINCGFNIVYFGLLTAFLQLVRISSAKTHVVSSKLGQNKSLMIFFIAITLSCLAFLIFRNIPIIIIALALMCSSSAMISPIILDIENKSISIQDRATALSIYAMCGDILSSAVNVAIGKVSDISIEASFIFCIIICFFALILLCLNFKGQFFYNDIFIKE